MSSESISLEETNRIRLSLGLKPIPAPSVLPPREDQHASKESLTLSETNKLRVSLGLKPIIEDPVVVEVQEPPINDERNDTLKKNIEKARLKNERKKLINRSKTLLNGLGDDEEEESTDNWLSNIKRPTKKSKTSERSLELKLTPKSPNGVSSGGLKIGHSSNDLSSINNDSIFTLKEQNILDEDDELESIELKRQQDIQKKINSKLRTDNYNDFGEEVSLLNKYQEHLGTDQDGDHIVLDSNGVSKTPTSLKPLTQPTDSQPESNKRRIQLSLSDDEDEVEKDSDYSEVKTVKMKKLKKKFQTKSNSRLREEIEDFQPQQVQLRDEDSRTEDNEELTSILNLKRFKNLKKRKTLSPEELANEIKEAQESEIETEENEKGLLVIDENTEFLGTISRNDGKSIEPSEKPFTIESPTEDLMEIEDEPKLLEHKVSEAEVSDSGSHIAETLNDPDQDKDTISFSGGLGSTLNFLKSKKIVESKTESEIENEHRVKSLKKTLDLQKISTEISKRIHEESLKTDSRFQKLSKKQKEEILQEELDQFKDLQDPIEVADKLANYKPEIKLKYIDEYGRQLNQKEAFKQLSHQFHGKAPSRSKVEKKKKKVEDERNSQYKESLFGVARSVNSE